MTTEEARDLEHATNLKIARELIDITWRDSDGCTINEDVLREISRNLMAAEKGLRVGISIRRARKDSGD